MSDPIVFEPYAKGLLFLHFVAGVAMAGTIVYLGWRLLQAWRRRTVVLRLTKLHTAIFAGCYLFCFAMGGLVYPTFRIRVRAEYFDTAIPWATGLFEAKEHFATTGLMAVLALALMSWVLPRRLEEKDRKFLPMVAGLVVYLAFLVGFNVWSGWYLTTLKGV